MANCFLAAFASVFSGGQPVDPAPHQTCPSSVVLDSVNFSAEDVGTIFSALDTNSSMGPDGLHPHLLRSCSEALAYPLYTIFCKSLAEGSLPAEWKTSLVVPIFKKGSRYDPLNYRPISLTSVPGKCMERLICREIHQFLEANEVLSDEQFGFRPGRSTDDQLLLTYNDVTKSLDGGLVSDLILFDFSKAFDMVCHSVLLEKLSCLGFRDQVIDWIRDFLVGRTMKVIVKDAQSETAEVLSGVPQGSVLGPVLFLLFINYVAANLTCKYKIFADDLKVYTCIDPNADSEEQMSDFQHDVRRLHETASSWGLKMNLRKCAVLRFRRRFHPIVAPAYTLEGNPIPVVASQTDLGIIIDDTLKFHEHACPNCSTESRRGCTKPAEIYCLQISRFHVIPAQGAYPPCPRVCFGGVEHGLRAGQKETRVSPETLDTTRAGSGDEGIRRTVESSRLILCRGAPSQSRPS